MSHPPTQKNPKHCVQILYTRGMFKIACGLSNAAHKHICTHCIDQKLVLGFPLEAHSLQKLPFWIISKGRILGS
jgi:hypothetical protein